VELRGFEPLLLPVEIPFDLQVHSVSFRFSPARYLRFRSRVLTASKDRMALVIRTTATQRAKRSLRCACRDASVWLWAPAVRGQIEELVPYCLDDAPNIVCFEQFDQIGGRLRGQKHGGARSRNEAAVVEELLDFGSGHLGQMLGSRSL
jgi:hypothetical protein